MYVNMLVGVGVGVGGQTVRPGKNIPNPQAVVCTATGH